MLLVWQIPSCPIVGENPQAHQSNKRFPFPKIELAIHAALSFYAIAKDSVSTPLEKKYGGLRLR